MPPPPARTPATVASLHSHPAEAETEEWPAETRTLDLDGMETTAGDAAVEGCRDDADEVPRVEAPSPKTTSRGGPRVEAPVVPEKEDTPVPEENVSSWRAPSSNVTSSPLGSKTPAAPALGSPSRRRRLPRR